MPTGRGVTRSRKERNEKAATIAENIRQCLETIAPLLPETSGINKLLNEDLVEESSAYQMPPIGGKSLENRDKDNVIVTEFVSPGEFYIRNELEQDTYSRILQLLQNFFESRDVKPTEKAMLGKVYAVQQLDNSWERCKILNLDNSSCEEVTVHLIDVGLTKDVFKAQIFEVGDELLQFPPQAKYCRLWGVRPAGDFSKWSKASIDHALRICKSSTAYVKIYHTDEEHGTAVNYVRLYFEQLKQLSVLEYEQYVTTCFNDYLFENALALRQLMPVTVQPLNGWPMQREIPNHFVAVPAFIDDDASVHLHPVGPCDQKEAINGLLNSHYAKFKSEAEEHWAVGEACIVKGLLSYLKKLKRGDETDGIQFYRATILKADDETKEAEIFLIDYARYIVSVKYERLCKVLVGFEYAPQAWRCRLAKYPQNLPIEEDELKLLDGILLNAQCSVSVRERGEIPLIDIHLQEGHDNGYDMAKVFKILRPDTPAHIPIVELEETGSYSFIPSSTEKSSEPHRPQCRRPNPLSLQADTEDEALPNANIRNQRAKKKQFSEENALQAKQSKFNPVVGKAGTSTRNFNLEQNTPLLACTPLLKKEPELNEVEKSGDDSSSDSKNEFEESSVADIETHDKALFHFDGIMKIVQLEAPLGRLFPLRILTIKSKCVWFQPARYEFNDAPKIWEEHYEKVQRLYSEMQRVAPCFPNISEFKIGLPCACFLPKREMKWLRGQIVAVDGAKVRVSFYEHEARKLFLPKANVKQLPIEYLSAPKSIMSYRLHTALKENQSSERKLTPLRKLVSEGQNYYGYLKPMKKPGDVDEQPYLMLRYKDDYGNYISAVDGIF